MHAPIIIHDVIITRERAPVGPAYVDFHPLFVAHGLEVQGRAIRPDVIRYAELERRGVLGFFAARRRAEVVGYSCHFAYRSLHWQENVGHDDFWYVIPELRGHGIGSALRQQGLKWAKSIGCAYVEAIMFRDLANRKLLKKLGYYRQGIRWRYDFPSDQELSHG